MSLWELWVLALGLAMDAFAVAVCKGLALAKINLEAAAKVGLWFGGFQAIMPILGYLAGQRFTGAITAVDHWIAFGLLSIIGLNMILEALGKRERENGSLGFGTMLALSVATSIDAFAAGVTFAFITVDIRLAAAIIGLTTGALSMLGAKAGGLMGEKCGVWAELAGGAMLLLLGLKMLVENIV